MHYYEVIPNRIIRANQASLTYASKETLATGQIVRIEVGKKILNGIITSTTTKPTYDVKEIVAVLDDTPVPNAHLQLAFWLSEYYATPLATVLQTMLPRGLEKTRRSKASSAHSVARKRTNFVLNTDQKRAIKQIESSESGTSLLHGVTGSGKTAVYIELVKNQLSRGKSAIVLVPEISLTSQLIDEFSHHFTHIIVTHSAQTEAERHTAWLAALHAAEPTVVIGPRSALFMPLASIGIIIVDESHEPSYKQEQSPRYHAARAAHVLARQHGARVILGSATPSVLDYYLARQSPNRIAVLPKPAQAATKPDVKLIDMTKRSNFHSHRFLSDSLIREIEQNLASNKQTLLFHNRRGSTAVTLCENCGWQAGCPRCYVPLTLHADYHQLRCHICGLTSQVPTSCPECNHTAIIHKGIGTKLIESELRKLFPKATIARFDGDTHANDTVHSRYQDLYNGEIQIIVGTQVIAKGLDLPHLRTVGVVQADAGLSLPDYSSTERTFQLLAQVVGRVGRSHHQTTVVVQSYQPNHPIVTAGLSQNYEAFYARTIAERRKSHFPPFCYVLKLTCTYKTEAAAVRNAQQLAAILRNHLPNEVEILGPTPSFYERVRDTYRWQLVLKSPRREHLLEAIKHTPPTYWQFVLDPVSLLS